MEDPVVAGVKREAERPNGPCFQKLCEKGSSTADISFRLIKKKYILISKNVDLSVLFGY